MQADEALRRKLARIAPAAGGYREVGERSTTDRSIREHVASELERLRGKIAELKSAADEEGEEDMLDDLDRFDGRMTRTIDALRAADYTGVAFFTDPVVGEAHLRRVSAYDRALIEDLELLAADVMGMKYETIGNLTLREAEGTLAAIEMKVTNRKDAFEMSGED